MPGPGGGVTVYMALSLQHPAQAGPTLQTHLGLKLNSLERQDGMERARAWESGWRDSILCHLPTAPAPAARFPPSLSSDRTGLHAFPLMALQVQFQLPGALSSFFSFFSASSNKPGKWTTTPLPGRHGHEIELGHRGTSHLKRREIHALMLTAASLMMAKTGKEPSCPSVDINDGQRKCGSATKRDYYTAVKRRKCQ